MKKVLAIVLAVCMLAAMTVAASAASPIETVGGTDTHQIYGKYAAEDGTAYYVTVAWGDMKFDYTPTTQVWDHENHLFKEGSAEGGTWTPVGSGNKISVENHSSVAVNIAFSAAKNGTPAAGDHSEIGTFSKSTLNLIAPTRGVSALPDGAKGEVTYLPGGTLDSTVTDYADIGTLTVTLNAAA